LFENAPDSADFAVEFLPLKGCEHGWASIPSPSLFNLVMPPEALQLYISLPVVIDSAELRHLSLFVLSFLLKLLFIWIFIEVSFLSNHVQTSNMI
jgi:hypothetical protein